MRAVGSSLERRFLLHEAEAGGVDVVVMQVQTDGSSQIEHYAEETADVSFILLGYWKQCPEYVEAFQTFSATADAAWQDHNLAGYGVGPDQVAEIVMTNTKTDREREAGVRTNGSSLQRRFDLAEAESGGVDTATPEPLPLSG